MSAEIVDYANVLADLRARRAALDSLIVGLEQWLNLGGADDAGQAPVGERRPESVELRADSFFGLSIPDAIRKYLAIAKGPQSLSDISNALQKGGLITTSKNLISTVSATLVRMKRTDGDVIPVQGKWGLAEWYKGIRREKLEPQKQRKRGRPKGQRKADVSRESHGPTPEQMVQMRALRDAGKTYGQIAKELGIATLTVWRTLKAKDEKKDAEAAG